MSESNWNLARDLMRTHRLMDVTRVDTGWKLKFHHDGAAIRKVVFVNDDDFHVLTLMVMGELLRSKR